MPAALPTRAVLAVLSLAAIAAAAGTARAQQPPEQTTVLQAEVDAAQDALTRGVAEFDGPQQSRSIVVFDTVIARLDAVGFRSLPPRGRDILAQAYEYRARAYYGIGLSEKTSEDFRQLIQLRPDYALSRERVSPKIVELFDSLKRTLVGQLAVSSDPPGAQVTLVSASGVRSDLPLTDFFPVEVLAGEYEVQVARSGYRTETQSVSIAAEETKTLLRVRRLMEVYPGPVPYRPFAEKSFMMSANRLPSPADTHSSLSLSGFTPTCSRMRLDIRVLPSAS